MELLQRHYSPRAVMGLLAPLSQRKDQLTRDCILLAHLYLNRLPLKRESVNKGTEGCHSPETSGSDA